MFFVHHGLRAAGHPEQKRGASLTEENLLQLVLALFVRSLSWSHCSDWLPPNKGNTLHGAMHYIGAQVLRPKSPKTIGVDARYALRQTEPALTLARHCFF